MARISVILGAIMAILCLNNVQARMYFLPDYQTGTYLKRSNDSALGQSVSSSSLQSCADLGNYISAAQKGNMDCNVVKSLPGIGVCYSDCYCNTSTYKYSTSNCSYTLTGSVCVSNKSYYTECKQTCNDVTHKSCTYGCQSAYSVCSSKCQTCYADNCRNRTAQSCAYGCSAYYSDCSSKCQTCYADNCRNRTTKSCDYGCQSYYADCPSKCETCKTCTPTNCSAYTLTSCPANGNCSSCTAGCGNNTLKYKLDSCASGYTKSGNSCVNQCSSYYACGGTWQYCTGTTCPTDSSLCSVSCVNDYFPYDCSSQSACNSAGGVYRNGYCSVSCGGSYEEECDSARSTMDKEPYCIYGCRVYDCWGNCAWCVYSSSCRSSYGTQFGMTYEGAEEYVLVEKEAKNGRCYTEYCSADDSYGIYCYY